MASISGCATTANFFELTPTTVENSGYWTGAHQNISVATLKLNSDGSGTICQDYNGSAKLLSVKKVSNKLYTQDGSFWKFRSNSADKLELEYGFGGKYILSADNNLSMITPACSKELK